MPGCVSRQLYLLLDALENFDILISSFPTHLEVNTTVRKHTLSQYSIYMGENIFRSYIGSTSENTDFHVLVAELTFACLTTRWKYDVIYLTFLALDVIL